MPADEVGARIIHLGWMGWVALLYINFGWVDGVDGVDGVGGAFIHLFGDGWMAWRVTLACGA